MFSLQDKTAVVTGGGSGIGRAICQAFARQGAMVHIVDLNADHAGETKTLIEEAEGQASVHTCDVSDHAAVAALFSQIGPIHILVNNAGIAHVGKADTTDEADFDRLMRINVKGVYNCLHAAIPQMKLAGGGSIINMASIASLVGIPDRFAYSTTKGAVKAMMMSVAKDYVADNIRCNAISPARVHTPFVDGFLAKNYPGKEAEMFEKLSKTQPIGRMAQPKEIAALALYLASDEASFITGCDYPIDGGFVNINN